MAISETIHLWTLTTPPRLGAGEGERLVSLLSPKEKDRYQKIGHEPRRIEYLLGHALLRLKVAEVLGVKQLPLGWEEGRRPGSGKPVLTGLTHFVSLTHKNGCVAVALAPAPIGIDLEVVEESRFAAEIVRRFFSEREQEIVLNLATAEKTLRFTQLWSLKEALFKATPHPIETIFRQTEFAIKKDGGVGFTSPLPDLKPSEWQFQFLNPRPRHLLALAVQSREPLRVVEKHIPVAEIVPGTRANH